LSSSTILAYTSYPETDVMAKNFGLKFYHVSNRKVRNDPVHKTSFQYCNEIGVPGCLVELNTQWDISTRSVAEGIRGIRNLLKQFKLMEGHPQLPPEQFRCSGAEVFVRVPAMEREAYVTKGDLLGRLLDPGTLKQEEIVAPISGGLWLIGRMSVGGDVSLEARHAYTNPGDIVAVIKRVQVESNA